MTPRPITDEELQNWFSYHKPTEFQQVRMRTVRDAALYFAKTLVACMPPGADATATIRKLRDVMMSANQAIACKPRGPDAGA